MLAGKRIVLGVTGGIAAYKAVEICRRLVDAGAHVIPVMTAGVERFLGATTLSALASEPERVFSRDELAGVLWGYDSLGESRAVDVHIRRLRAKLEPFGDEAPPILTVRGFGYKLGEAGTGDEA